MSRKDCKNNPDISIVNIIGDVWVILIIRALIQNSCRFGEIQREVVGISTATLSNRLKKLEKEKIISKKVVQTTPIRIEYTLTKKGSSLSSLIEEVEKISNLFNKEQTL